MNMLVASPLLVVTAATPVPSSSVPGVASADTLSIQGVGVGTLRSRVRSILGKPKSVQRGRDAEMGLSQWEVMHFPGLTVEVALPEPGYLKTPLREPYVWRIVISGSRWVTKSGLRVGQTREDVLASLGPAASEDSEEETTTLHYYTKGFDGFLWVRLRDNVVVELGVSEDWT